MAWDQIAGQRQHLKGKAKDQWGKLTDDNLNEIKGKRDQLIGKLQQKYGYAKDEAERHLDQWERELTS